MADASRSILIRAPKEKVFDLITAYETYPQFLPEVKEVKVSDRSGTQVSVHYKVDFTVKTVQYTLRMTEERPNKASWTFVRGEIMKDNKGTWVLEDSGDGMTKATYSINVQLPMLVPKGVVNTLVGASLPKMLEAFKKRAEAG